MKKILIALLVVFSFAGFQQATAQKIKHQKTYTTPYGKAVGYKGTNPKRKDVHLPQGKAVGWHGRNPNRAKGGYRH